MKTNCTYVLIAFLAFAGQLTAFSATSFTPTGVIDMLPTSISDDGSIVVGTGTFGAPNLYYTEAGGAVVIGDGCASGVATISGDGSTVLGCHLDANGKANAAKWLGGMSWLDLGSVDGGLPCDIFLSGAYGVNGDGSLGVGLLYGTTQCKANAGTWDLVSGGPGTYLPSEFGDTTYSRANAVNADGNVIVGWQDQMDGQRVAAKWVKGVEQLILTSSGGFNGEALAVSADGKTIVGLGYDFGPQAWIWRLETGVQPIYTAGTSGSAQVGLAQPESHPTAVATDVSDDGKVVVGYTRLGFSNRAFIWKKDAGVRYLDEFLRHRGAAPADGWSLLFASVISGDGRTLYGWGIDPDQLIEMYKVVLY
jgi:uncharacterized membrane protein